MLRKTSLLLVLFVVAPLLLSACDTSGGCDDPTPGPNTGPTVIEDHYAARGPYTTTNTSVTGFRIYYPRNMTGNHPILTWGNGTGTPPAGYGPLLNHLASWGFVVIASTSTNTGSGKEMIAGIDYMIEQNNRAGSTFYGMLDTARIGATGHSQGGGGAVNAATDARVLCSAPMAPAPGSVRNVKGPMLLIAGARDTIVSASLVRSMVYNGSPVPTIFAIQQDMGHLDFAYTGGAAVGYLTAWFMYKLQDDDYAADAFTVNGECEICNNPNWKVETKNF